MPPKKENPGADANTLLVGFEDKETKLLAAAFLSSLGPDKFDYEVMSTLTGNTAGSLKKMWPPVKKKALETCPSFAKFLSTDGGNIAAPKATGGRKRKAAADADVEDTETKDADPKSAGDKSDSANKSEGKAETKKKAPMAKGKGRPAKKTKKEEVKAEEDSADGGDGLDKEKDVDEEA